MQICLSRGRRSRNKVAVGEPAAGSLQHRRTTIASAMGVSQRARSEHRASDVRRASSSTFLTSRQHHHAYRCEACLIERVFSYRANLGVSLGVAMPGHPLTNTNCENTHPTHCTTQINHTHPWSKHNKQGVVTLTVKNLQQRIPWFSRR